MRYLVIEGKSLKYFQRSRGSMRYFSKAVVSPVKLQEGASTGNTKVVPCWSNCSLVSVEVCERAGNNLHLSVCCFLKVLEAESAPG